MENGEIVAKDCGDTFIFCCRSMSILAASGVVRPVVIDNIVLSTVYNFSAGKVAESGERTVEVKNKEKTENGTSMGETGKEFEPVGPTRREVEAANRKEREQYGEPNRKSKSGH